MNRAWQIWTPFVICLGVIAAVMTWLSLTTWRLDALRENDRQETELARREAELQERINSALYRMDLVMLPIISQEAARPPSHYADASQVVGTFPEFTEVQSSGPSQLIGEPTEQVQEFHSLVSPLANTPPLIRLHFQINNESVVTSPQNASEDLATFESTIDYMSLLAMTLPDDSVTPSEQLAGAMELTNNVYGVPAASLVPEGAYGKNKLAVQQSRGTQRANEEYESRRKSTNVFANSALTNNVANLGEALPDFGDVGTMRPIWQDDQLLLVRRANRDGQSVVQGCWMDFAKVRITLLEKVSDLVANADLQPQLADAESDASRSLTTLPLQLVIDEQAALADLAIDSQLPTSSRSGLSTSLVIAWLALALAAFATAFLIQQILNLSERRAAFVSAVTHELRTPLTTFRMYAEMLAEEMVPDEKKRQYAETLRTQADRLSLLVENVLQFARLERSPQPLPTETVAIADMMSRFEDRLIERASQADLLVVPEIPEEVGQLSVATQPAAVEQIVFNLVDNACKYGVPSTTQRITVTVASDSKAAVAIRVRDDGPGVSSAVASELFRPFHKSDQDAANTAPGVGLGLALSRRLAHSIGGKLVVVAATQGACFELSIPIR